MIEKTLSHTEFEEKKIFVVCILNLQSQKFAFILIKNNYLHKKNFLCTKVSI